MAKAQGPKGPERNKVMERGISSGPGSYVTGEWGAAVCCPQGFGMVPPPP